ncbi:MAG: hypothetical protein COW65_09140 [Cytophagales bacterium CG18_big_fil_WC_8_21_14_2_50_42_9]|nr:MAG: hypothetical protein COW65_09140 [Cytophagales bacterium CG18_big_fil_WC_8_21_14_2_50_42_9]
MRIGLVLSGGAARGFAHLGVLKALDELQIKVHIISGTSSGAIAGAFYAAGYSPEETLRTVSETKILRLMRPAFSRFGLLKMGEVEKEFSKYFGDKTFADLSPQLVIATTDINRAIAVYFREGKLVKPLMAASSVPILYQPVAYQGHLLIDGGLLNNMPVECIMGDCDFIIGVHTNPLDYQEDITTFRNLVERTCHIAINNNVEPRLKLCHFLIEPPELKKYSLLEMKKAKEMFINGYEYTLQLAPKLLAQIKLATANQA